MPLMAKQRTYSRYARQAVILMGEQIRLGRKQRKWTEKSLAERAGISRATLQKIENGEMSSAIGLVFEVATLVGLKLFELFRLSDATYGSQVTYLTTISGVIFGMVLLGERPSLWVWAAVACIVAGMVLVGRGSGRG